MNWIKRHWFLALILLACTVVFGAGVVQKWPTDTLQWGLGSNGEDKTLTIDVGDGGSNPVITIPIATKDFVFSKALDVAANLLTVGDGAGANQEVVFDIGAGSANPRFKWNNSLTQLEFSNNGTDFSAVGSGAGGTGAVNILINPDIELGSTTGYTEVGGGTLAVTSTPADVAFDVYSLSYDAGSASDAVLTNLINIPVGLYSQNCLGQIHYKGGDSNLTFEVVDGSSNVLVSQSLVASTGYRTASLSFVCPGSGSIRLRVIASADAAEIFLDNLHLGNNFLVGQVSQTEFVGKAGYNSIVNCKWTTASTSVVDFPADSDCTNTFEEGAVTLQTDKPAIDIVDAPPGKYVVYVSFNTAPTLVVASHGYVLTNAADNTLDKKNYTGDFSGGTTRNTIYMHGEQEITTSQTISFKLRGFTVDGGEPIGISCDGSNSVQFIVIRYPLSSQLVYQVDEVGWYVDATITGANPDLGTATVGVDTEIIDAGLSIVDNHNSIPVEIPCSGTNPSTGATCSAGSESLGVVFDAPFAGDVLACVTFAHVINISNGVVQTFFRIAETPNDAQTILQISDSLQDNANNVDAAEQWAFPFRLCDVLTFSSTGQKTLRLMYKQSVTPTVNSSAVNADNSSDRAVRWEVYPLRSFIQAPLLVNTVISSNPVVERLVRATIGYSVGVPTVARQSGGIVSLDDDGVGDVGVNFDAGVFSDPPSCVATGADNPADTNIPVFKITALSLTTAQVGIYAHGSSTVSDRDFHLLCMGQK